MVTGRLVRRLIGGGGGGGSAPRVTVFSGSLTTAGTIVLAFTPTEYGITYTYQWQKDGVDIDGATSQAYVITDASTADNGAYRVVYTENGGDSKTTGSKTVAITNDFDWIGTRVFDDGSTGGAISFSRDIVAYDWAGDERAVNTPRYSRRNVPITGRVVLEDTGIEISSNQADIHAVGKGHDNVTTIVVTEQATENSHRVYWGSEAQFKNGTASSNGIAWSNLATVVGAPAGTVYRPQSALVHHGLIVLFCQRTRSSVIEGVTMIYSQDYGATWAYVPARDIDGDPVVASSSVGIGDVPAIPGLTGATGFQQPWSMGQFPVDSLDDIRKVRFTWADYQFKSGSPGGGSFGAFEATRSSDTGLWILKDNRLIYQFENASDVGLHSHGAGVCTAGLLGCWGDVGYRNHFSFHAFDWNTYETATVTTTVEYHGGYTPDASLYSLSPQPTSPTPGPNGSTVWSGDTKLGQVLQTLDVTDPSEPLQLEELDRTVEYTAGGGQFTGPDPIHLRFAKGVSGKLWTAGVSSGGHHLISRDGYNFAKLHLRSTDDSVGGGRLYSDGDLLFFRKGGNIFTAPIPQIFTAKLLEAAPGAKEYQDPTYKWTQRIAPGGTNTVQDVYYDGTNYRFDSDDSLLDPQPPQPPVRPGVPLKLFTFVDHAAGGRWDLRATKNTMVRKFYYPMMAVWPYDHSQGCAFELQPFTLHTSYVSGTLRLWEIFDTEKWTLLIADGEVGVDSNISFPELTINSRSNGTFSPGAYLVQCVGYMDQSKGSYPADIAMFSTSPDELFSVSTPIVDQTWTIGGSIHWPEITPQRNGDFPLFTIYGDADNHIVLSHDLTNGEVDVIITSGGSVVATIVLTTGQIGRGDTAHFLVTSDGTNISAAVSTVRDYDSGTAVQQLVTAPTQIRNGNSDQSSISSLGIAGLAWSDNAMGTDNFLSEFKQLRYLS